MANYAPNTSVFSYVFFVLLSSFLLYLDFTNETFSKPKNTYKTSVLSLNYFFKNYILEPLVQFPELLNSKKNLIKQNRKVFGYKSIFQKETIVFCELIQQRAKI